jgi:hypothetical protein
VLIFNMVFQRATSVHILLLSFPLSIFLLCISRLIFSPGKIGRIPVNITEHTTFKNSRKPRENSLIFQIKIFSQIIS